MRLSWLLPLAILAAGCVAPYKARVNTLVFDFLRQHSQ